MNVWWRGKRKIPADPEKVKKLRKKLKDCKNSIESKRMNIMIVYLNWADIEKTAKILWISKATIRRTTNRYVEDEEWFYKTKFRGRVESEKKKELKQEVKEVVERRIDKWEYIDINDVVRRINKMHKKEVIDYNTARLILRRGLKYNYQKPFIRNKKSSKHAKEIVKGRLTKAIIKVWLEERDIDAEAIKNKKRKFGEAMA